MDKILSYGKHWLDDEDKKAVLDVLESDFLTQGPKVTEFEKSISDYTGAKYCVVVSSGTAALHLAIMALKIPKESEGITSPITFVASANALVYNEIKPIFADIDVRTYNIDPREIRKKITKKTTVIVPVDFAGRPADMNEIAKIAKENKLYVVEDASHAIGSIYKDGSRVGGGKYSDLTTFSFHPVKTITTGEGGAITTNDEKLYRKLLLLRSHGITKNLDELSRNLGPWYYEMQRLGYNYRMTDMQAALGISQLKKIGKFKARRQEIVRRYNEAFAQLDNVTIPYENGGFDNCFHLYILKIDFAKLNQTRANIVAKLKLRNIETQVHYIPVHLQPYYQKEYNYKKGDLPKAEKYYSECLSLPLYPKMTDKDIERVISSVKDVLKGGL